MKRKNILLFILVVFATQLAHNQTDIELITNTLINYIEGTANGEPDRIKKAFDSDLKLYYVSEDSLKARSGEQYIKGFKKGVKINRIGRIVSIDFENNAASAKVEVIMPNLKRIYTDYFLLLKYEGTWKIVHKSYTYRDYPE